MSEEKVFTSEQAKEIGEMLGINWSKFNIEQFRMGMDVELEHGTIDPLTNVTDNDTFSYRQNCTCTFDRISRLLY